MGCFQQSFCGCRYVVGHSVAQNFWFDDVYSPSETQDSEAGFVHVIELDAQSNPSFRVGTFARFDRRGNPPALNPFGNARLETKRGLAA
jgi:hypothetical protein